MFILAIRVIVTSSKKNHDFNKQKNPKKLAIKTMVSIAGVMILFGLTWLFGALTIRSASKVFQYLFVIFNAFQGFFFFLFICILGKDGREFWVQLSKRRRSTTTKSSFVVNKMAIGTNNSKSLPKTGSTGLASESLKRDSGTLSPITNCPSAMTDSVSEASSPSSNELERIRESSLDKGCKTIIQLQNDLIHSNDGVFTTASAGGMELFGEMAITNESSTIFNESVLEPDEERSSTNDDMTSTQDESNNSGDMEINGSASLNLNHDLA